MNAKSLIKFSLALLYSIAIFPRKGRRVVLYYHGIKSSEAAKFEKQMEYIARTCGVIPPSKILDRGLARGKYTVAITFDDAFENLAANALPVLERHAISAGIFVPAGNLGRNPGWELEEDCTDSGEAVMDEHRIAEVAGRGHEIHSHTLTHPRLNELDPEELKRELHESKKRLEAITGSAVEAVSYPHGEFSEAVLAEAARAGYRLGFTIIPEIVSDATDRLRVGRTSVSPNDPFPVFWLKVRGAYAVLNYFRKRK